ncbi:MAG: tRNA threonylcarbamoyladenosine dehydratase [Oscillospiraceae bacterium]|nr:tRNA threonylcarbamoyladenosine dehydratase [Oscillospiraceae bacterium]
MFDISRTALLLGEEGVMRLAKARVAVFGLGGVGSYTAEALARAGMGGLTLIDRDTVDESNLNRQLIALRSTIGQPKAEVMAARVRDINPDCAVRVYVLFYPVGDGAEARVPAAKNAATGYMATEGAYVKGLDLLAGCDMVCDAMDTVTAKIALAEECRAKNIPLISAMGCGNKLDPSRFRVADLFETHTCPLCRVMRRELSARGFSALRVVFSDEQPQPHRDPVGSVSFVPSVAGLLMAGDVIKRLAGIEEREK